MNATQELKNEHGGVLQMLRVLEAASDRLEANEPVSSGDLEGIIEFLQVFVDRCHHGKEEDLLFPALEAAGMPTEGGPVGVMLAEHDMGRSFIRGLKQGVERYSGGDTSAVGQILENARGYIALLRDHIDKEDNILYPMADRVLTPRTEAELVEGYEAIERERIGPGRHEAFHELIDRLSAKYLGQTEAHG